MRAFLQEVLNIAVPLFAIASMFVVGSRFKLREILEPFRNVRGTLLVLISNFILVPLLAYGLTELVSGHPSLAIGLVVVGTAAGAAFLLQLTKVARGNMLLSSGLLVILILVTIATMPFLVPLAAPEVTVRASSIAGPLLLTMLLPLAVGAGLRTQWFDWSQRLWPIASRIASISFLVLIVLTLLLNIGDVIALAGTGAILAAVILVLGAYAIGFVMGEVGGESRAEVGLATAMRNIAAATIVAIESIRDPDVLVMVVVTGVLSLAILLPISGITGRLRLRVQQPAAKGKVTS